MDATYKTLRAAIELGEFTADALARQSGVGLPTVRTVLNRHRQMFDQTPGQSGRRGGQVILWKVKESASRELSELVGRISSQFSPEETTPLQAGQTFASDLMRIRPGRVRPELVTADELNAYPEIHPLEAQPLLPHLVRRLLVRSHGTIGVSARAGAGIGLPGFDGVVREAPATTFLPAGPFVVEIGTGNDPAKKAQEDYSKRALSEDFDPRQAFVFISMRRFPNSKEWSNRRRSENKWRDVVALDADDLEGWLEENPSVHVWLSEQMGLRPFEVRSLGDWWTSWSNQTRPPLPADLVLAGRQAEALEMSQLLGQNAQAVGICAGSREEALAFIAAALLGADNEQEVDGKLPAAALVVRTVEEWSRLVLSREKLLLIPEPDDVDVPAAVAAGHTVLLPMAPIDNRGSARIVLPKLDREQAQAALLAANWTWEEATRDSAHARRSLISLRRSRSLNPRAKNPYWAANIDYASLLAPLVLVGSWLADSAEDQGVVSQIAGRQYEEIERTLRLLVTEGDPPFVLSGGTWRLSSPQDAWTLLYRVLTGQHLTEWGKAALEVLSERDPSLEAAGNDPFAALSGSRMRYSVALRWGLTQGAALLGCAEQDLVLSGKSFRVHADAFVSAVLTQTNKERNWRSLDDLLPLVAESSPDVFLRSLEAGLDMPDQPVGDLFVTKRHALWGNSVSYHGYLWALQSLSWSEEFAGLAILLLARIAAFAQENELADSPRSTLRAILLPWLPQTTLSVKRRLEILDAIAQRYNTVGWPLLLSLLPRHYDTSSPTRRPAFRQWPTTSEGVPVHEWRAVIDGILGLVLRSLETEPQHWDEFIEVIADLPVEDFDRCVEALSGVKPSDLSEGGRTSLWSAITRLTSRHRQYASTDWALRDEALTRLEKVAGELERLVGVERFVRFFDWHPDLPGTDKTDRQAYAKRHAEVKCHAISEIISQDETDLMRTLIDRVKVPYAVGEAAAEVAGDERREEFISLLDSAAPARRQAAAGWIRRMLSSGGVPWRTKLLEDIAHLSDCARAEVYLCLESEPSTWSLVDGESAAVQEAYWQDLRPYSGEEEHERELVLRLLAHKRPWAAIEVMSRNPDREVFDVGLIERSLNEAIDSPEVLYNDPVMGGYYVQQLLDGLERKGAPAATLFRFEWQFFEALEHERAPRAINAALKEDPALFVELVCAVFRGSDDERKEGTSAETAKARQGYSVLRQWREVPGAESGRIDPVKLNAWVHDARNLLAESRRTDIGDHCIGQLLSGSPLGSDGIWPAEPVRDLLERLRSRYILNGLANGKFNSFGVVMSSPYAGGDRDRQLASQYDEWAARVMVHWPETARLLKQMARDHQPLASWHDREADSRADSD